MKTSPWIPLECRCGHMDSEHDQDDDRFGCCLACNRCPGFEAAS